MYPVNKITVPPGHDPASAKLAKNNQNHDRVAVGRRMARFGGFGIFGRFGKIRKIGEGEGEL